MKRFLASTVFAASFALSMQAHAADRIRMLAPTWLGFAPVHVANDLGYFSAMGLEVEFKFEDDRANVMAAMARGDIEVDARTVGEYQGRPRNPQTPDVIIGTIDQSVGGDGVITDGAVKSVADLKNKTVAAEPNIPARLLLQLELKKAGLGLADLHIKDIASADTAAVFADKSIAAIATYEPFMSQAIKASTRPGARVLFSSKDYPGIIVDVITARQDDLVAHPDKYAKFLRGVYMAIDFAAKDPDKFAALAAPHFGLTVADVKEILRTSLAYTPLDEAKRFLGEPGKPGQLHKTFATVMQLNIENGAADVRLDPDKQINNGVINQVRLAAP